MERLHPQIGRLGRQGIADIQDAHCMLPGEAV
jgi:hypothetical protein